VRSNAKFAQKQGFHFPLLCDEKRELGMAYRACETPDASSARRISYVIGPDGRIVRSYDKVNFLGHARTVLDELPG
jgi:peroxiredoxin Q/BCP